MRSDPRFIGMFFGIINKVYKPSDRTNTSKKQYEYDVVITMEPYCQIPVRCIKMDYSCGSTVNYEDEILDTGQRVFVEFPLGDPSMGVIVGGSRFSMFATEEEDIKWLKIFNLFEQKIDKDGKWTVKSYLDPLKITSGGYISIDKQKVTIGDLFTVPIHDMIELDGTSNKITIKAGSWEVQVLKEANITVIGDVTLKCKNASITALGAVDLKAKSVAVTSLQSIDIKSAQGVNLDAPQINMNKGAGMVLTTVTQPACYITGLPFMGSPTVKAT